MVEVLFEDNHLLIVNKPAGILVQGDKSGDKSLVDTLKEYISKKYDKQGNVFLGLVNRIDRPVSGIVVFTKTSKALSRMNDIVQQREIKKIYHCIVYEKPEQSEMHLVNYLFKNESKNKSFCYNKQIENSKLAELKYKVIGFSERYCFLEIELITGRHHQIRCQLSHIGCIIKGDLKYGAKRPNIDGSISLHSRKLIFIHPITKHEIVITADYPKKDKLWQFIK